MKLLDFKNPVFAREILLTTLSRIFKEGPVNSQDLEILSYISLFQPALITEYIDDIILYLGEFYKTSNEMKSLQACVLLLFQNAIKEHCQKNFTPMQASIYSNEIENHVFSFSAPTSTGKSYVLLSVIEKCQHDVVVVVPSRALINEYYLRLSEEIPDKTVNILTYVDKINLQKCRKNIFILTPERCKDLFRLKRQFNIEIILFDEAQLTDEKGKRGLYFDSIVRRCNRELPQTKMLFAHPFIENPEAQIQKNGLPPKGSSYALYRQRNVGQIFICRKESGNFCYFGSDNTIFGTQQLLCDNDPIENSIKRGGSVLFYVSKNSIINNGFLNSFHKYIELCPEQENPDMLQYIEELRDFTGGDTIAYMNYYSQMLSLLKRGIVIHHGSLPLHARVLIEKFTRAGYCKICFATSTLEQGINMPFDIVYIDRLESSKELSVKNLIGRAGRSSTSRKIDYGTVIVAASKVSKLRKILKSETKINPVSQFEVNDDCLDDEFKDFKEAIVNNTFSDQFNLTQNKIKILSNHELDSVLEQILDVFFVGNQENGFEKLDAQAKRNLKDLFVEFYMNYLERNLAEGEERVFRTAISILIMKIQGQTFRNICHRRYAYISKMQERNEKERLGISTDSINAQFSQKCQDLPNSSLIHPIPLFGCGTKAREVDYDIVTYDTYDYLDKVINLYLSDIFYAAFLKYNERNLDERAIRMAKLVKYGTFNDKHIWMLRYGISFENIDILASCIDNIDEGGIVVNNHFYDLSEKYQKCISRFID